MRLIRRYFPIIFITIILVVTIYVSFFSISYSIFNYKNVIELPKKLWKEFGDSSDKETLHTEINKDRTSKENINLLHLNLEFITVAEAEQLYYQTITKNTINCDKQIRLGRQVDGGWDICISDNYMLKSPTCLSYSFGVNYIWEFDDAVSTKYQCTVRTFDPSMTKEADQFQRPSKVWFYKIGLGKEDTTWSNGWSIMKMSSILKKFNEENQVIDILKIDIEYSEWDALESMIKEGLLAKVKQIMFETHTEEVQGRTTTKENFVRYLRLWNDLYEAGFRQWKNSWNHFGNYFSKHTNTQRTCCYEHYLININYMKSVRPSLR